jgi:hypothetical protein
LHIIIFALLLGSKLSNTASFMQGQSACGYTCSTKLFFVTEKSCKILNNIGKTAYPHHLWISLWNVHMTFLRKAREDGPVPSLVKF